MKKIISILLLFSFCFSFAACGKSEVKEAAKRDKYNPAVWFYAAVSGESRWLKTGNYGKIEYSYYNSKLIMPFNELIK